MEHTSEVVAEGKFIGETSYQERPERYTEVEIDGVKIDFYDARNKIVHEVKKSDKAKDAHIAQVKYYIYKLKENGVDGVTGLIEYPGMRQTEVVKLSEDDICNIREWEKDIERIINQETCPPLLRKPICKKCSYYDFCYIEEEP